MNLEEQRPLLDRADEEERGDISSNNDVTGQEQKEVVESIIQNYVCFTLYKQDWLVLLACFLGVGMLDGSMYSNGIFTDKMSQDLGVTEEAIQGAASLEVVEVIWVMNREPSFLQHQNIGVIIVYTVADFLAVASIYMPYARLPGVTPNLAKNLIATIGGGSFLGRFASGEICNSKRTKMLHKLILTTVAITSTAAIPAIYANWFDFDDRIDYVLCFLFSLLTGCWISATSPIMVNLLGSSNLGTAFGTLTLMRGAATFLSGITVAQAEEAGGKAPLYISSGLFSGAAVFFALAALKIGWRRATVKDF